MDIKINADMNSAIEQIADKLGTTAKDIIPQYTKLALIRGVVWVLAGFLELVAAWVIHPSVGGGEDAAFLVLALKVALTFAGFVSVGTHVENIFAPKAIAIEELIAGMRSGQS